MQVKGSFKIRDGEIRTHGLFHPKEARYQAAPRPVTATLVSLENYFCQMRSAEVWRKMKGRLFTALSQVRLSRVEDREQFAQLSREMMQRAALV